MQSTRLQIHCFTFPSGLINMSEVHKERISSVKFFCFFVSPPLEHGKFNLTHLPKVFDLDFRSELYRTNVFRPSIRIQFRHAQVVTSLVFFELFSRSFGLIFTVLRFFGNSLFLLSSLLSSSFFNLSKFSKQFLCISVGFFVAVIFFNIPLA